MINALQKQLIEKLIADLSKLEVHTPLSEFYDRLFLAQPKASTNILILQLLRAKAEILKMNVECSTAALIGDIAGVDVQSFKEASTNLGAVLTTIENLIKEFQLYEQWE